MDADVSKFVSQVSQLAGLIRQYAKDRFEITDILCLFDRRKFHPLMKLNEQIHFLKKLYTLIILFCPQLSSRWRRE